jgi:UPF0755 protein
MAAEKKKPKATSNNKKIITGVLLALVLVGAIFGYKYYTTYFSKNTTQKVEDKTYLYIRTGATYDDVLSSLREKDYLLSVDQFDKVARQRGYDEKIRPGKYHIKPGMSNLDLVRMLMGGKQEPVKFTFNNIRLKKELAAKVGRNLEADSLRMETILGDDGYWKKFGFTAENCMVLFLPDTYEFWWNTDTDEFVDKMAKEYKKFWTDERKAKAKKIGLSQADVSIMAAIVEKESNMRDERPTIAGVYMNRLNKGMKLQADPTVVYALGDFTVKRVLNADTRIDSPYNTYMYAGLPPGPICLPSKNSIDAVLNYKKHTYIYFCAKEDFSGYHNFATTYDEHLKNAAKFQKALNERGISR